MPVRAQDRDTEHPTPRSQSDLRDQGQPSNSGAAASLCPSQNGPRGLPAARVMTARTETEAQNNRMSLADNWVTWAREGPFPDA